MVVTVPVILVAGGLVFVLLGLGVNVVLEKFHVEAPQRVLFRWVMMASGVIMIGAGTWLSMNRDISPTQTPPRRDDTSALSLPLSNAKYDFESGTMGWRAQDHARVTACRSVASSDEEKHSGRRSLALMLQMDGSSPVKSQGEAWVNLVKQHANGKQTYTDLENRTISAWVFAPAGSAGPSDRPNGVQLFVKDGDWRSWYGAWNNVREAEWVQVELDLGAAESAGYRDGNFDATRVAGLGVKVATGGESKATYVGHIYVDDVDW